MKWLVSIDPGLPACGVAVYDEAGALMRAALVRNVAESEADLPRRWQKMALSVTEWIGKRPLATELVVEMPQIYKTAQQEGDQNDLVALAGVTSALCTLVFASTARIVYPRQWKGTLEKAAMVERIKGRLSPEEHSRVHLPTAASLQHNVWDGIGIGLHAFGRLDPKRVFPR
jgi:hypothetical protein